MGLVSEPLTQNAEETYIFERNGEVFGFLTLGGCRDTDVDQRMTGEIWGIYLAPSHWRQGIGTVLCRYGERILKSRGYRLATLWVFSGNDQAKRFYEAMGFLPDGRSKEIDWGTLLTAVRYSKALKVNESWT